MEPLSCVFLLLSEMALPRLMSIPVVIWET